MTSQSIGGIIRRTAANGSTQAVSVPTIEFPEPFTRDRPINVASVPLGGPGEETKETLVHRWFPILLAVAALAGCQSQKPASQASPAVLDVSPTQTPVAASSSRSPASAQSPAPGYMLPSATPPAQPVNVVEMSPPPAIPAAASAPATASKYTVKKGDTLYHIAKEKYGDGKQWQRIAAANPGVSPSTLKVGQILVMP
jgi:nucleoid-associated protein YgaU